MAGGQQREGSQGTQSRTEDSGEDDDGAKVEREYDPEQVHTARYRTTTPEQRLALAVIELAMNDLRYEECRDAEAAMIAQDARRFLTSDSCTFHFWASVLGSPNPEMLSARFRELSPALVRERLQVREGLGYRRQKDPRNIFGRGKSLTRRTYA